MIFVQWYFSIAFIRIDCRFSLDPQISCRYYDELARATPVQVREGLDTEPRPTAATKCTGNTACPCRFSAHGEPISIRIQSSTPSAFVPGYKACQVWSTNQ